MRVLIVEDEPDVAEVLSLAFAMQWSDTEVRVASDGESALDLLSSFVPAIVLLDVALPGMDGFEVLREIRRFSDVPVLMLTVRDDEREIVKGLELGADDYVTKPFSHLQLFARVRAVLRRAAAAPVAEGAKLELDDLVVDFTSWEVRRAGRRVDLTPTEYNVLYHLARNAGRVVPHEALLSRVWGHEYRHELDYIKVFIRRLREKLEPDPRSPRYILTERGVGYKLAKPAAARELTAS